MIKFTSAKWQQDSDGELWLMLKVSKDKIMSAKKFVAEIADKTYTATFKLFRNPRGLSANAYMWELLQKLSVALKSTSEDVYRLMIHRYGFFYPIPVVPEDVDDFTSKWQSSGIGWLIEQCGRYEMYGKEVVELHCWPGSSSYDTKQMSVLIDGVIDECKQLDIETLPPEKLAIMKEEWGRSKAKDQKQQISQ